jgi:hypothetical protein
MKTENEQKTSDRNWINVYTTHGTFGFVGRYRRDLETKRWHYYEREDGTILHFRKSHIVAVVGDNAASVKSAQAPSG